jgi:hypothetical protein
MLELLGRRQIGSTLRWIHMCVGGGGEEEEEEPMMSTCGRQVGAWLDARIGDGRSEAT